jgi:hypothetical protein
MPLMEMTAMSAQPPPMSTTMFPLGSRWKTGANGRGHGLFDEIDLAGARQAESCTARFSTGVISPGTPMTIRGCPKRGDCAPSE